MSTSTDCQSRRNARTITSAATSRPAIASPAAVPVATRIVPASTASDPARSDAKCSAFEASAGEPYRRALRPLATIRETSTAITTASTTKAHQVASTPSPPPSTRRRTDSMPIASATSSSTALSPSAARCSALPCP